MLRRSMPVVVALAAAACTPAAAPPASPAAPSASAAERHPYEVKAEPERPRRGTARPVEPPPEARSEPPPPDAPDPKVVALEAWLLDGEALFAHLERARRACGHGTVARILGGRGVQVRFAEPCEVPPLGRVKGGARVETIARDGAEAVVVTFDHFEFDDGLPPNVRFTNMVVNGRQASITYTGTLELARKDGRLEATRADPELLDTFAARLGARTMLGAAAAIGKPLLAVAGPMLVAASKTSAYAGTALATAVAAGIRAAARR